MGISNLRYSNFVHFQTGVVHPAIGGLRLLRIYLRRPSFGRLIRPATATSVVTNAFGSEGQGGAVAARVDSSRLAGGCCRLNCSLHARSNCRPHSRHSIRRLFRLRHPLASGSATC